MATFEVRERYHVHDFDVTYFDLQYSTLAYETENESGTTDECFHASIVPLDRRPQIL